MIQSYDEKAGNHIELPCFFCVPNSILSEAEGTEFGIVVCGCKGYFIESNVDKLWHFQDLYGLIIGIIDTC